MVSKRRKLEELVSPLRRAVVLHGQGPAMPHDGATGARTVCAWPGTANVAAMTASNAAARLRAANGRARRSGSGVLRRARQPGACETGNRVKNTIG